VKVLVTGGAGFIGSHIVRGALAQGHAVRVLDNLSEGSLNNLDEVLSDVEMLIGDLRDEELVRKAVRQVEAVYHLAALASVPRSMAEPMLFHDVNSRGTFLLFNEAARAGVRRVVFSSSSAVYGDTEAEKNVETQPPSPLSPYAATKLDGEIYGHVFTKAMNLEVVSLRYFNVYGPRQSVTSQYAAVIPIFISRALRNQPLTVYGDGEQTRDFVYVEDVVRANFLAMETQGVAAQAFNVSGDCPVSLNQLIGVLRTLMPDRALKVDYAPPRAGDIRHSRADISKARKVLGFEPKVGLEEGLRRTMGEHVKRKT
jgi:UDP-glucose 4-epimerase